jgi:HPt (histidine-containing phosphotransfer) domain-containing protein
VIANICDPTIVNLQILAEIYDDESSETITAALSGFSEAAKLNLTALEESFLAESLTEVSAVAHNLSGICRFSGVVYLGSLSEQLDSAAKMKKKSLVTHLISEIFVHWPILEEQINSVLKYYRSPDD